MTDNDKGKPRSDDGPSRSVRKPRGLGGVILIMALLLALFVMISRSGMEREASIYDFYRYLFNGLIQSTEWTEGRVIAQVTDPDDKQKRLKIEVVLDKSVIDDAALIRGLLPYGGRIDTVSYDGGVRKFLADVESDEIVVKQAFFVAELPSTIGPRGGGEPPPEIAKEAHYYVTAVVATDRAEQLVRVTPAPDDARHTLLDVRRALAARDVPIEDRALALDPRTMRVEQPNTALFYFMGTIGPWLLVLIIVWFFIIRQMRAPGGSGGVLSFGRSRAALYTKENRTNVTFDDVAGIEEAKGELREIIEFLKNPGKFAKLGGNIPRGVLLVGSPGTGKTLLAKAIAGEAEVPFFSISGSDFVEMFVGVGASRVRDLFKQARENSPCLVFLDEIDAVGRKRGSGMGGGHDEREQTLNAILVEMDGFDSDKGTILIAATNRPDVLDPALMRPGRFDRQVVIDMPDVRGREDILKVHARKIKLRPDVDLKRIARATSGFSGAELAALVNEAAILAAMRNKEAVDLAELEEARDRIRWGREKRSRALENEDLRVTAYHEAGHALVSSLLPHVDPVHKVTIVSRGMALGATMSLPERDDYHQRRDKLLGMIAMCYGGRIAEEIVFGDISAGAQNDIETATRIAKIMVCELGMSDVAGPVNYSAGRENVFLGNELRLATDTSEETLAMLNREIRRICDEQYARARDLILAHRDELDAISAGLLQFETLTGDEVSAILRGDRLEDYRAARKRTSLPPPKASAQGQDEPDVGLSGAEGLAHS
jgi:cell division protease FtsH